MNSTQPVSLDILAARFAYAGAVVTTLGDVLSTISAAIALQILEQDSGTQTVTFEADAMQQQIDELILEMQQLKSILNRG